MQIGVRGPGASLLGYVMLGLFSGGLIVAWAVISYVEVAVATVIGGWLYREP